MSLMVIGIDSMILNVALPTLVRDVHASTSELQWIVDAYVLVIAGMLLTAGSLGDRFGRREALTAGLVLFGASSLAAAWASDASQLIVCRALMGLGAAFIMPSTLSILTNMFTAPTERGRAIGVWAGVSGIGVAVGPVVGGLLLEHFWWGSVFLVNVPIVVAALVLGQWLLPTSKDPSARPLDPIGAVLSMAGLSVLLWTIIGAPERGWGDQTTIVGFMVAGALLAMFTLWELHYDHPMLDVSFFRNPRFTVATLALAMSFFGMAGEIFVLTQLLQFVMGFDALNAGLRVAPLAIVLLVGGPISPRLAERYGSKLMVTVGLTLSAFGLALLSMTEVGTRYPQVLVAIVTIALGFALSMAPATESIMGSVPRTRAGVGSAVNNTMRQVGGALGVAVLGGILVSGYHAALDAHARMLGLSGGSLEAARASVGSAIQVARGVGGRAGAAIANVASEAFVHGLHLSLGVGAAVCLFGAFLALAFLPARAPHHALDATEYLPAEMVIDIDELDAAVAAD